MVKGCPLLCLIILTKTKTYVKRFCNFVDLFIDLFVEYSIFPLFILGNMLIWSVLIHAMCLFKDGIETAVRELAERTKRTHTYSGCTY